MKRVIGNCSAHEKSSSRQVFSRDLGFNFIKNLGPGQRHAGATTWAVAIFFCLPISQIHAKARRPEPGKSEEVYSLSQAKSVPIAAKKTKLPLIVYGEEEGASSTFVPSGAMGDSKSMKVKATDFSAPLSSKKAGTTCLRVEVKPKGTEGWVGLYWQTPANNWGKIKGAGYDLTQATKLTFWARGEKGGERITDIKLGGLIGPYPDTDSASIGPLRLTSEWVQYTIDLTGKDLRHIIGGFAFTLRRSDNPRGAVFYLDEIMYQGEPVTPSIVTSSVTEVVVAPTPAPAPKLAKAVKIVIPFASAKSALSNQKNEAIDELSAVALQYPDSKILVDGHTDNIGPKETNKKLSYQRAKAVADYLESKGVKSERMTVTGYGEERPLREDSNSTAEGRLANRRVEVTLLP